MRPPPAPRWIRAVVAVVGVVAWCALTPTLFPTSSGAQGGVSAAAVVTPYSLSVDGAWATAAGSTVVAQSFTTGDKPITLSSIGIWLRNADATNSYAVNSAFTLEVRTSSYGVPGSLVETVVAAQPFGAWSDETVQVPAAVELDAATEYFVVLSGSAGGTIGWKYTATTPTSDVVPTPTFTNVSSADGGSSWSAGPASGGFDMVVSGTTMAPTTLPPTTAPATTVPPTTAPPTTVPPTTVPSTTVPATTVPATTVPPTTTTLLPGVPAFGATGGTGGTGGKGGNGGGSGRQSSAMDDLTTLPTPTTTTTASPRAGGPASLALELEFEVGSEVKGSTVMVRANGLQAGSTARGVVYSEPVVIGTALADDAGAVAARFRLPSKLEAGEHRIEVQGTGADGSPVTQTGYFAVAADGTIARIGAAPQDSSGAARSTSAPSLGEPVASSSDDAAALPSWTPADHPDQVVNTQIAAFALLGIAGTGALAMSGSSALSGMGGYAGLGGVLGAGAGYRGDRRRRSGKVGSAKVKHLKVRHDGEARGDASNTWNWRATARLDDWSQRVPVVLAPRSPLLARVVNDGVYLRAMFGALWWAAPIVGLIAGLAAAIDSGGQALPPAAWLVAVIAVLGVLDATVGLAAVLAFLIAVVLAGGVTGADSVRTLMGIAAIWFAVPLIASAARPLRRVPPEDAEERFDRFGDLVIISLIGAWACLKMIGGLPGLAGLELPLADSAGDVALVVLAALVVRVGLESFAASAYPRRLDEVSPTKIPWSSARQRLAATALRTAVFVFVASAFLGNCWQLWVGAVMFCVPQVLKIYEDRFPNVAGLYAALPRGVVKVLVFLVIGKLLGSWLEGRLDDPVRFIAVGFVVLSLPGLFESLLSLFGREGAEVEHNWAIRIAGTGAVCVTALIAGGVLL